MRTDKFVITVMDGNQKSEKLEIPIEIMRRVFNQQKFNQLVNNSMLVKENQTIELPVSILPQFHSMDEDQLNRNNFQYFVVASPTKGKLLLNIDRDLSYFSYEDIVNNQLIYKHGPAEVGVKQTYDIAQIWSVDQSKTFILNFTLIPINSQAPQIKSETVLQVN